MANKVIEGLVQDVRDSVDKLINAVRQHDSVQKDLPQPAEPKAKPADDKAKPADENKPQDK